MGGPERTDEHNDSEVAERTGDGPIPRIGSAARFLANLSGCWHSVYSAGLGTSAT